MNSWSFSVEGLVARPTTWTWDEIHGLPGSVYSGDIHCVTTWSKLGVQFSGVSVDTLLDIAGLDASASYVVAFCHTGYTTNFPLADVTGGRAWVVWSTRVHRCRSNTGDRPASLSRISTFGRVRSGWPGYGCSTTTSRGSGSATATTIVGTLGSNSATRVSRASGPRVEVTDGLCG